MTKMKNFSWAKTAVTLLFATFTSAGAWAQSESVELSLQTNDGNYLIQSVADWNNLAEYVADGNDCEGMTFLMTANIGSETAPVTMPIGRQIGPANNDAEKEQMRKRFAGTFDGGGNTLTIELSAKDLEEIEDPADPFYYNNGYCSPFAYVKNATIQNLHVAGTVTTYGQWASGLVGSTGNNKNDGICTIENCQVSVDIYANYESHNSKYGNHGGFIGIAEGKATIKNSWFDGKFLGVDYQYSAGFIGMNKGIRTELTNCLFNPSAINVEGNNITGSCEFVHDMNGGSHTLTDAYWVSHFGEPENAQGQKVVTEVAMEIPQGGGDYSYYVETVAAADFKEESENYYYIVKHNPTWEDLKNKMAAGGGIVLNAGNAAIIAGSEDEALVVPAGKEFTLKLDGTLDRDLMLAEAKANGYVIKVEQGGTLTINGGTITGGHNTGNGGGIYNAGTLNLIGVTIKDNFITQGDGAGIYNAGTLTIDGATITGNLSKNVNSKGVGVYVAEGSSISIQGDVQIHDNIYKNQTPTVVTAPNNLYLNTAMTINGNIEGSNIGMHASSDMVFTSGLKNNKNGSLDNFTCDKEGFEIVWNEGETEARLSCKTILVLANNETNSGNLSDYNNKVAKVILSGRTLVKDGNWNTLCLPFALSNFNGTPLADAIVMEFNTKTSDFANGTLTLNFANVTSIKAGKPYIVKWTSGQDIVAPEFVGVTVKNTAAETINPNGAVSFVGSYDPVSIGSEGDKTKLYMGANNTLYYPNGEMTIGACRAYFQLNNGIVAGDLANGVRSIVLNFDDEATGIVSIAKETEIVKEGWFSLNGMKLDKQPTTKGLYIQNGRKVIVK